MKTGNCPVYTVQLHYKTAQKGKQRIEIKLLTVVTSGEGLGLGRQVVKKNFHIFSVYPKTRSTPSTQILVSKYNSPLKKKYGFLEK